MLAQIQGRNERIEFGVQGGVQINVPDLHTIVVSVGKLIQNRQHVITQVTTAATIKRQRWLGKFQIGSRHPDREKNGPGLALHQHRNPLTGAE